MGAGRWVITAHAVRRYVKRIDPTITEQQAWRHLSREVVTSTLLDGRTYTGQQRWLLPQGNAVAVAKVDLDIGAHVAVTVLKPDELYDPETAGEIVKAYRRAISVRAQSKTSREHFPQMPHVAPGPVVDYREMYATLCVKYNELSGVHRALSDSVTISPEDEAVVGALHSLRCANNELRSERDMLRSKLESGADAAELVKKCRAHAAQSEAHASLLKGLLREAIRGLREGTSADTILARMKAVNAGLATDAFCYPERFTKEERRAMSVDARRHGVDSGEES